MKNSIFVHFAQFHHLFFYSVHVFSLKNHLKNSFISVIIKILNQYVSLFFIFLPLPSLRNPRYRLVNGTGDFSFSAAAGVLLRTKADLLTESAGKVGSVREAASPRSLRD